MSSECKCHIPNAFCFYCDVYKSLEYKHEAQRRAIERVIAELKEMADHSSLIWRNKWADRREYHDGREDGLTIALEKLEEVINRAHDNSGKTSDDQ